MQFYFGWKECAGLLSVGFEIFNRNWCIHLLVQRKYWSLGKKMDWHDGPMYTFGLGPLLLISWF